MVDPKPFVYPPGGWLHIDSTVDPPKITGHIHLKPEGSLSPSESPNQIRTIPVAPWLKQRSDQ